MFDDFPAADYEHGTTADMEKRYYEIRNIYARLGYTINYYKTTKDPARDEETGRRFIQIHKSFGVLDVPLKCLNGKRAKELLIHLWINT